MLDVVRMALQVDVDCSGSMQHYERIETAVAGLKELTSVLRPTDLFGISTFSKEVQNLHRVMERSKVAVDKDVQHVLANCAKGSCTSFYDAVVAGVCKLNDAKGYLRSKRDGKRMPEWEHVMITDGEDNDSAATFEQACAAVRRPGLSNYQFVVIGVGLSDRIAARLAEMCTPAHCHFHREADASALSRRLEELRKGYLLRFQATSGGVTRSKTVATSDAVQADALQEKFLRGMMDLTKQKKLHGGNSKPKALPSSSAGGSDDAAKCHWDKKCTNASCTFKHSVGKCHWDKKCTKHRSGQCSFRHSWTSG
eukprot:gene13550-33065_t